MPRPPKLQQVDYFPHMCNHRETMFTVEQKFGNDGYAFWFKLLEILGSRSGHYIDTNQAQSWEFLQARTRCSEEKCTQILDLLAKLGAIDNELWTGEKTIWSQNFVDNLCHVYKKRLSEIPLKPSFRSGNSEKGEFPERKLQIEGVSAAEVRQRIGQDRTGEERKHALPKIEPETTEPEPQDLSCLDDHSWQQFRSSMPLIEGRFQDEDACREKWTKIRSRHKDILTAVTHYRASRQVQDGAVMSPMKFISGRFKEWVEQITQPLGPPGKSEESRNVDADNLVKERMEYEARIAAREAETPRKRITIECQAQQQT